MSRIAFLTSANMVPSAPDAREDIHELTNQFGTFAPACAALGLPLEPVIWDAPDTDWAVYDAVLIGTTWDYWDQPHAFLTALKAIEERGLRLLNPYSVVRWNLDKIYLRQLKEVGVAMTPTLWRDNAHADTILAAFDVLNANTIVVKPRVGAGAFRLAKLSRGEPMPPADALPDGPSMIQAFLPAMASEGEVSLLYYDGAFSHAVRKIPAQADFRVQSIYGAREVDHAPTTAELALAETTLAGVLATTGQRRLLYARIDIAQGLEGAPVLMEAELIEPYHYPIHGPGCGERFAQALKNVLAETAVG